jgi:uncharacterized protein YacL
LFGKVFERDEIMLEVMLEIVGEIIVDLIMLFVLRIKFDERVEYFERRRAKPTYFTYIGAAIVGACIGFLLSYLVPQRLLPSPTIPGISLILLPFFVGLIMRGFGNWRERNGQRPSVLASFWGGALFAFGMALVRWSRIG